MTCIVGLTHKGTIYMGGDSAAVSGSKLEVLQVEKVFRKRGLLIGGSGSFRVMNLIRHSLELPEYDSRADPERWLVNVFASYVRKCLLLAGSVNKDKTDDIDANVLIGIKGHLFTMEGDLNITQNREPFAAIGTGADVAMGAMFASKERVPQVRIRLALKAAERFTTNVRAPFLIRKL